MYKMSEEQEKKEALESKWDWLEHLPPPPPLMPPTTHSPSPYISPEVLSPPPTTTPIPQAQPPLPPPTLFSTVSYPNLHHLLPFLHLLLCLSLRLSTPSHPTIFSSPLIQPLNPHLTPTCSYLKHSLYSLKSHLYPLHALSTPFPIQSIQCQAQPTLQLTLSGLQNCMTPQTTSPVPLTDQSHPPNLCLVPHDLPLPIAAPPTFKHLLFTFSPMQHTQERSAVGEQDGKKPECTQEVETACSDCVEIGDHNYNTRSKTEKEQPEEIGKLFPLREV